MKAFFKVTNLDKVLEHASTLSTVNTEKIDLKETVGRILCGDIVSEVDLPGFTRSTMDGYAVDASSTFGASEGNPVYLTVSGIVDTGESPSFLVGSQEAAKISTGGMLPHGTNSVVMVEYTEVIDDTTIEVYRSVAPGQHVIEKDEDFRKMDVILPKGLRLRPQEMGLLAAFGNKFVEVYKKPVVGILSTGNEVVPIDVQPNPGQIRDVNSYSLSGLVKCAGGIPVNFGIIKDDFDDLRNTCAKALEDSDMVLVSGGSSVGAHDFTLDMINSLPGAKTLVHGIAISPGKPTILAKVGSKAVWGLPGQVVSAMVVFEIVVKPFIKHISGLKKENDIQHRIPATLSRGVSSVQGRVDYMRVRLVLKDNILVAEPVLGKSGLINTMVKADGLIKIGINTEGLDQGSKVLVIPLS
jgi:molybdopterin molybdotransferase